MTECISWYLGQPECGSLNSNLCRTVPLVRQVTGRGHNTSPSAGEVETVVLALEGDQHMTSSLSTLLVEPISPYVMLLKDCV